MTAAAVGGLGQAHLPYLLRAQLRRADLAARHRGDVHGAAALGQQRQRARALELHVVRMAAEGQHAPRRLAWHGQNLAVMVVCSRRPGMRTTSRSAS